MSIDEKTMSRRAFHELRNALFLRYTQHRKDGIHFAELSREAQRAHDDAESAFCNFENCELEE